MRAAFGAEEPGEGDKVADLWAEVRSTGLVLAEIVAVIDDELVGHVGVSHCWLDARQELVDVAMLSPLSALPSKQSHGIGTALVTAAIEAARELGRPALFLEGSPEFYGRRGFTGASTFGFEAPSRRTPEAAFQVVPFDSRADWMTGRVVYPRRVVAARLCGAARSRLGVAPRSCSRGTSRLNDTSNACSIDWVGAHLCLATRMAT
ncbi:GNAT family N-acetyltransferase [Nocardioides sp. B-3]|uniref:GNAT family N-acetyltransferase n=1 Tax=Nocardioides sp. B-3 TaxID=2895565 RepID=UPI002153895F|nr:N-acetyltransferase [Nocardioides sp. B-3]UUZ61780.1 N-acetyltransferase [Nocardioides sp. B-3]